MMNVADDSFGGSMTRDTKGSLPGDSGKNAVDAPLQAAHRLRRSCSWVSPIVALAVLGSATPRSAAIAANRQQWIGTWATAPQPSIPGHPQIFENQSLRLVVHSSASGSKVRIKISNTFGDDPLVIGSAHIARR